MEIALERGATLTGQVLDEQREPLPRIVVWALPKARSQKELGMIASTMTRTDGEGRYVLTGLDTGPHEIRMEEQSGGRTTAVLVDLQPGTQRRDFLLALGVEVAGSVRDETGAPVAGAQILLAVPQTGFSSPAETFSLPDGSFRIPHVPAGRSELTAAKSGFIPVQQELEVADQPIRGLELRLARGGAIVGTLLGLPQHDLMRVRITGFSVGQPTAWGGAEGNGRYRLPNLAPGEWLVTAVLESGRRVEAQVTLEPGAAEGVLDLDLTESP